MTAYTSIAFALVALSIAACNRPTAPPAEPDAPPPRDRTEQPSYTAPHVETGAIAIDGQANDEAWQAAPISDALVGPGDGRYLADSPVNARARLAWSDEALYVWMRVDDREHASPNHPNDIDPHVWATASGIEVMLQPGTPDDNREYYEIQVGVAEEIWDTRFDDYNSPITGDGDARQFGHQDWSAQLERTVARGETGYTVEMAIPWTALSSTRVAVPPAAGDSWRMNLYSFRDGQRHALAWSPIMGEGNFHRASRFGMLTFGE